MLRIPEDLAESKLFSARSEDRQHDPDMFRDVGNIVKKVLENCFSGAKAEAGRNETKDGRKETGGDHGYTEWRVYV